MPRRPRPSVSPLPTRCSTSIARPTPSTTCRWKCAAAASTRATTTTSTTRQAPMGNAPADELATRSVETRALETRRISTAVGAEVKGIDLKRPLSVSQVQDLPRAAGENGILLFRGVGLSPEDHVAFSRHFGELEAHVIGDFALPGRPEIFVVSNVKEDGKLKGAVYAGQYWHSDLSYMAKPSLGSLLLCREMPDVGGDTMWANMYMAYDTLR